MKPLILLAMLDSILTGILAESQIETCDDRGTGALNCTQKMVVLMTLDRGQARAEERLQVQIRELKDAQGGEYILKESLRIDLEKSALYSIYPLEYQ